MFQAYLLKGETKSNIIVAGFPVSFMYFSRHLVPAFKSRDLSSVHVMTRVYKTLLLCMRFTRSNDELDELDELVE